MTIKLSRSQRRHNVQVNDNSTGAIELRGRLHCGEHGGRGRGKSVDAGETPARARVPPEGIVSMKWSDFVRHTFVFIL